MFKKFITIVILVVIVWVAYQLILQSLEKEPEEEDEITNLLEDFKKEAGIDFSEICDVEFKWITEVDPKVKEVNVRGKGFEATGITDEQYLSIEPFFQGKEFKMDLYNVSAGTVAGAVGYKLTSPAGRKDDIVCLIVAGVTGYKEAEGGWTPQETDKNDVDIKCGELKKAEN